MIRFGVREIAASLKLCAALLLIVLAVGQACADSVVEVVPERAVFDLAKAGTRVAAQRRNLALEVPGDAEGQSRVLELRGQGPGPDFNWTIYAIKNTGPEPRDLLLIVDQQGFSGSGFWPTRPQGPQITNVLWTPDQQGLNWQRVSGDDTLSFRLAAGASMSIALEGLADIKDVRLIDEGAHQRRSLAITFLRGAAMAATFLVMLGLLAAFGFRANRALLAGSCFCLASLGFMALDSGYWSLFRLEINDGVFSLQDARAVVEAVLVIAVCLMLTTLGWGKRWPVKAVPFLFFFAGLLALAGAFLSPVWSSGLSRVLLLAAVATGCVNALLSRSATENSLRRGFVFWSALSAWALLAAYATTDVESAKLYHAMLVTGLAVVTVILGMVMARLVWSEGFLSKPTLADAGRRSLALSGAQHFMWDWQPLERKLDVSPELLAALGYDVARLNATGMARMIEAIVHPDDLASYRQVLEPQGMRNGEFMEREIRLRDADGGYLWFELRARGLPGQGSMPGRMIGTLTEITRHKRAEDRLISEAVRDPVTGLPSRALFLDRLDRAIGKPLSPPVRVLMVGIERFKVVNDGLGHDLGDQILLLVGQRINECLTKDESVARVSGSQFCIMCLESIDARDALTLAGEVVAKLASPIPVMNSEVVLSVSVGISRLSGEGYSSQELQKQAASALHEAQNRGPRTILEFDVSIKDERADRLALENDLRRAIDRREIEIHYQPIVDLETREVAGLEALARWRHPKRGLLPPADYIGLAEQAGLISEIGYLVLAEAARQMGIWQRVLTRGRPVYVSVNISSEQLSDSSLLDKVASLIAREGLQPHALKIELTESVVMRYPERTRLLVERLHSLGVGVACDDFGTGFSNLASLRDLQFDTLKMDRSFIADGGLDAKGGLILASVINLANSLGMRVVAEGIETEEQAVRLLALGCNLGQGYYLGGPVPSREVHGLLAVLPVVKPLHGQEFADAPMPGRAPLAPRPAPQYIAYEPEELPSLFAVTAAAARKTPEKKRKRKTAKPKPKTKSKKPRRK